MTDHDEKMTFPCICCQKCGAKFGWIGRALSAFHTCRKKDNFEMAKIHAITALQYWTLSNEERDFLFKDENGKSVRLELKKIE